MRKRVADWEQKIKNQEESQKKMKVSPTKYGHQSKKIKFPFLTFENDKYSDFMNLIMQNLEVRSFRKDEMISYELE